MTRDLEVCRFAGAYRQAGVSDETRRTVVATAERLGYAGRPSKPAEVSSFEVLFHDRTVANRELWVDVQHGIEQEASRHGYPMAICWSNDHTLIERLERTTIGFVLVGPHEKQLHEAARDPAFQPSRSATSCLRSTPWTR